MHTLKSNTKATAIDDDIQEASKKSANAPLSNIVETAEACHFNEYTSSILWNHHALTHSQLSFLQAQSASKEKQYGGRAERNKCPQKSIAK